MKKLYYDVYAKNCFTKEALIKIFKNVIESIEKDTFSKIKSNSKLKMWIKEYSVFEEEDIIEYNKFNIFKEDKS